MDVALSAAMFRHLMNTRKESQPVSWFELTTWGDDGTAFDRQSATLGRRCLFFFGCRGAKKSAGNEIFREASQASRERTPFRYAIVMNQSLSRRRVNAATRSVCPVPNLAQEELN